MQLHAHGKSGASMSQFMQRDVQETDRKQKRKGDPCLDAR